MSQDTMRTAYLAIKRQQERIAELEAALAAGGGPAREPVAIVGIGCRFPGQVRGPRQFWEKLRAGFDGVKETPPERWAVDDHYDPDPEARGKISTRFGGYLDAVDRFDARFFGISPREAAAMDPQQRLLLETAWEALEDAGLPPEALAGTAAGVYVGLTVIDYAQLVAGGDLRRIDPHSATGNIANIAAGRISYILGLRGPAVTLDTACSSSLVAAHLACQSLHSGESTLALAAGVNLMLAPDTSVAVSRARMLSARGHCAAFDASADGYVRGEGCGVVVLKRLSDARKDGDRIWAVIRGSAVGQDGARSGLTVPNGMAQAALIRSALAGAGLPPAAVGYIEAHGTGTPLGDPIEAGALAEAFGRDARRETPLVVGSLKTNVGHMESAAGVGGLIKTALCVHYGEIPPHLHFERENPEVRLGEIPARVPTALGPWPGRSRRIAGVSSFGSSGTIAHILVEQSPESPRPEEPAAGGEMNWLLFSAKTAAAVAALAERHAAFLAELPPGVTLRDVCWTAAAGRQHFGHRRAAGGRTAAELIAALRSAEAPAAPPAPVGAYLAGAAPELTALFGARSGRRVGLPTYPFAEDRHWIEPAPGLPLRPRRARRPAPPRAPAFGIMFFNGTEAPAGPRYRLVLESARWADEAGFSSVWVPERHFTAFGALYPNPALLHAALARETQSIRLMAGSCVLPLHDPLRAVEAWSMVDNLSGGRAGMSFAAGWNPADFALAPERYAGRQEALFAGIAEARRLWRGEKVRRRGGDGREVEVRIYPSPVQPELPLWVTAAGNPATFERAGEIGANLLTHLLDQDPAALGEKIARYRAAWARAGRDPASGRVTVMLHTFLGPDRAAVDAKVREPYCRYLEENLHLLGGLGASRGRSVDPGQLSSDERKALARFLYERFAAERALLGTPEACAPLVRRLAEIGVDEIACLLDFGAAEADVLAMLPRLGEFKDAMQRTVEVRPAVGAEPAVRPAEGPAAAPLRVRGRPDCFWEIDWRPVPPPERPAKAASGPEWVVLGGEVAFAAELSANLRAWGGVVRTVAASALSPSGLATGGAAASPVAAGAPVAIGSAGSAQIIYLEPLGEPTDPIAPTLAMLRATRGRVWVVTRGAQRPGATGVSAASAPQVAGSEGPGEGGTPFPVPAAPGPEGANRPGGDASRSESQTALWALLRALPVEIPSRWGGLIDLDPAEPLLSGDGKLAKAELESPQSLPKGGGREEGGRVPSQAQLLAQMLVRQAAALDAAAGRASADSPAGPREDQLALRGGQWSAARLSALDMPPAAPFVADGAWLITGGLGGLGLALAEWLVSRGAREILLLSRRAQVTPETERRLAGLRAAGAEVAYDCADCADVGELKRAVADWQTAGRSPIAGVCHLAGVWKDQPLLEIDAAGLAEVWRPKAGAVGALEEALAGHGVSTWIYFSAFSALLPTLGQGAYAAANAWLDAHAAAQRARGLRALALDWGPWSEAGFALTDYGRRAHSRLEGLGIGRLRPAEAFVLLEQALAAERSSVGIMPIDWARFFAADPPARQSPILREHAQRAAAPAPAAGAAPIALALARAEPARHAAVLAGELARLVGAVLRIAGAELPQDAPLLELGVDSLLAIEIKNRLQQEAGVDLPLTDLLRGPTLAALCDQLLPAVKIAALSCAVSPASGPMEEIEL